MILYLAMLLSVFCVVSGCGQLPTGQGRNITFTVTGFTLPAAMAYTDMSNVIAQVPTISTSREAALSFAQNLIKKAVEDVLEQQGRDAFLADIVISAILQQLTYQIMYDPLKCSVAYTTGAQQAGGMDGHCFIISSTVMSLCAAANCQLDPPAAMVKPVPENHLTMTGTITTTNIIMANWSSQMWQSVLNRVARNLSSGPFRTNFSRIAVNLANQ